MQAALLVYYHVHHSLCDVARVRAALPDARLAVLLHCASVM
jgi:hypothetical protein